MIAVSVIIAAFNAQDTIGHQIHALMKQDFQDTFEIIVADNGSTDNTRAEVRQCLRESDVSIHVIDASTTSGPSHARNVGAHSSNGSILLICDADDIVHEHWITAMSEALLSHDIVGGTLETHWLNNQDTVQETTDKTWNSLPVAFAFLPYASTANLGMKREVFFDVGGWDESLQTGEDIDFCWRAQLVGYQLGFAEDAIVHYRLRTGTWDLMRQYYRYGRGSPKLYRRYRGFGASRRPALRVIRSFTWILMHPFDVLAGPQRRGPYLRSVAFFVGKVVGSFRSGVVYL